MVSCGGAAGEALDNALGGDDGSCAAKSIYSVWNYTNPIPSNTSIKIDLSLMTFDNLFTKKEIRTTNAPSYQEVCQDVKFIGNPFGGTLEIYADHDCYGGIVRPNIGTPYETYTYTNNCGELVFSSNSLKTYK